MSLSTETLWNSVLTFEPNWTLQVTPFAGTAHLSWSEKNLTFTPGRGLQGLPHPDTSSFPALVSTVVTPAEILLQTMEKPKTSCVSLAGWHEDTWCDGVSHIVDDNGELLLALPGSQACTFTILSSATSSETNWEITEGMRWDWWRQSLVHALRIFFADESGYLRFAGDETTTPAAFWPLLRQAFPHKLITLHAPRTNPTAYNPRWKRLLQNCGIAVNLEHKAEPVKGLSDLRQFPWHGWIGSSVTNQTALNYHINTRSPVIPEGLCQP